MRKKLLTMLLLSMTLTASVGLSGCFNVTNSSSNNDSTNSESSIPEEDSSTNDDSSSQAPVIATFTVTFNSDGGSAVEAQTIDEGENATAPTAPTKSGYTFGGWTLNGEAYDFETPVTSDIELVAVWTKAAVMYDVTFNSDGGSAVEAQTIEENETATEPTAPTKADCKFGGWLLNGEAYDFATPVTGNIELTAKWIALYSVSFNSNGGSAVEAQTIEENETATEPTAPTKADCKFGGWLLNGEAYDFATPVTGNIELTAKWIALYTVSFNSNGGSTVESQTIEENEVVSEPTAPTKDDCKFGGWLLNGEAYDFATPVTGDIELTAKWIAGYAVTFNSDGGSAVETQDVDEGQTVSEPTAPTKMGYVFAGWTLNGEAYNFATPITGDIELLATWSPAEGTAYAFEVYAEKLDGTYEYLTKYDKAGTTDSTVALGTEDLSLIPFGFEFDAENENNMLSGVVAADGSLLLKVYIKRAYFNVNYYDYDETLIYTESVKYEAGAVYSEEPTRETDSEGIYSFNAWVTEKDGADLADLTSIIEETSVFASYNAIGFSGNYISVEDLAQCSIWGSGNTTLAVSNEVTYNGESTLKIESAATKMGFGVFLPQTLMNLLLSQDNVQGVKLAFDYKVEASTNLAYTAIGWEGDGDSKNSARTGGEAFDWQRFETILTDIPSNFSISFSDNQSLAWDQDVSGIVYVANITYEAVEDLSEGILIDTSKSDSIEYISTDATFGTWSLDSTVQFNGKNTLKYEATTNANAQNQNRLYSIEAVVANLLAQENVIGVRVSTNYMVSGNSGMNYIGLSIDSDANGQFISSQQIGASNVWQSISSIFTSEMNQAILHVSPYQGSAWAASGSGSATVYFSDFTYELIYANEEATLSGGSSVYKWTGEMGTSSTEQYNGVDSITITDGGAWCMGVFVDNNQLRQLLALPNVTSVNVSFKYKAGTLSSNVHYVGFHGGKTVAIDRTDGWHEVSTKITALPANFIIGAGIVSGLEWINASISGTMYIADITFTVNYNEGATVNPATTQWQNPVSVAESTDYVYGTENNSTKVGFNVGYKYADIIVTPIKPLTTGYIEFYFKNTTGKALEIYTTQSLTENGGTTSISADTEWQFVRLAIDPSAATYYIQVRGAGETPANESEVVYYYLSSIVEGVANS